MNYLSARSLTEAEFNEEKVDLAEKEGSALTPPEDIKRIERILELSDGILAGERFYLSAARCLDCERTLNFYDLVFTALVEQWHDASFLAHTLVGSKYFINEPRPLRCADCGSRNVEAIVILPSPFPGGVPEIGHDCMYQTKKYGCCRRST